MNKLRKYRNIILLMIDVLIIFMSYFIVSFLIQDTHEFISSNNLELIRNTITFSVIIYEIFFNLLDIYKTITRYENGKDYLVYIGLCAGSSAVIIAMRFMFKLPLVDYKQIILAMLMIAIGMISYRVIIRFILNMNS